MMMKRNHEMPRLIAMFLVMLLMMMACLYMSATAYAADDPYKITITPPGGWASGTNVSVKIAVTDKQGHGWNTVEYALNNSGWIDITRMMTEGMTSLSVSENGQMTVRVTDNDGLQYEESMNILCLDADAPVVKAEIQESTLHVEVTDNISGIAGVQVGSMLFTTVENSALDIALDETMNKFEKLAVRAFDYAGNFSDPITLDNPNYHVEPDITPEPVNTPAPVETEKPKKPEKKETASEKKDEKEDEKPADTATAVPSVTYTGSASIYRPITSAVTEPEPFMPQATAEPQIIYVTPEPTPEPVIEKEYITLGPGMPYQSDGNSHTLDMLYSAATNKQFITLQTKSGNTFYLVIDYDKPIDEDAELYETYFMNLVDERDLLSLMSDEEVEAYEAEPDPTPTPQIVYVTPEPTVAPEPVATDPEPEKTDNSKMTGIIALVAILAIGGIAVFLFTKNKKGSGGGKPAFDYDEDDEDEEASDTDE